MSPDDICKLIASYNEIFEDNLTKVTAELVTHKDPDGDEYLFAYIPKPTGKHSRSGLKLKGGMGYISIEVQYKRLNKRGLEEVGHSFRYSNHRHTYSFEYEHEGKKQEHIDNYHFRYDKDLRPSNIQDPPEHLQVLHSAPRFLTNRIELRDFLIVVKQTCFTSANAAINESFFANRRTN